MNRYFITTIQNKKFSNLWVIIDELKVSLSTESNNLITEFKSNSIEERNVEIRRAISKVGQLYEIRRIIL